MRWQIEAWGGAVSGVASAGRSWSRRDGWLLSLWDEGNRVGVGEATPLPGFGRDEFDRARAALDQLPVPAEHASVASVFDFARSISSPSARFAVESALLDALARRRGEPLSALLQASTPTPVARQILIGRLDDDAVLERARAAVARGARALKAKTDAHDVDGDLERVRQLAALGVSVRLDLNGSLDVARARAALEAYAAAGVAWVEEPANDLLSLGGCAVPWLADESLVDHADRLLEAPECAGVVLKPTLLGGFSTCLALGRRARERGKQVIVSHAFEGPVALAGVTALALSLGAEAGVDRHAALDAFPPARLGELPDRADRLLPTLDPGLGVTWTR